MRCTFEPLPSPLMGEGAGGGEDCTSSPPSPPSPAPRQGGRSNLPLSALGGGLKPAVVRNSPVAVKDQWG
jgi:hypothetical protein